MFLRGYRVYDQVRAGFVTEGEGAERVGTRYAPRERGTGTGGHAYGTGLADADKKALVESLKTL